MSSEESDSEEAEEDKEEYTNTNSLCILEEHPSIVQSQSTDNEEIAPIEEQVIVRNTQRMKSEKKMTDKEEDEEHTPNLSVLENDQSIGQSIESEEEIVSSEQCTNEITESVEKHTENEIEEKNSNVEEYEEKEIAIANKEEEHDSESIEKENIVLGEFDIDWDGFTSTVEDTTSKELQNNGKIEIEEENEEQANDD